MGCCASKNQRVVAPAATSKHGDEGSIKSIKSYQSSNKKKGNSKEPLVLEYTPPSKLKPYRVENHFWEHKKKLIPDYNRMRVLDKRALEAPAALKEKPQDLVDYLIRGLTSELEKARVLMRWMGDNIAYDVEFLETGVRGDYSIESVLRTGRSVCQGYSDVLVHFCKFANINCEAISGLAKGGSYYPGKVFDTNGGDPSAHAWNKVQIKGEWYLCDPTWAAGAVDGSSGRRKFEKKWDEPWFLTHSEAFLPTHLPFKKNVGVLASEQLVRKPVSSLEVWSNNISSGPMTHAYNIQPVTHRDSIIKTTSAEVTIIFSNPYSNLMKQWTELTPHQSGQKYENRVMLYTVGNKVHVNVRLPGKGSYSLKILGRIMTPEWPNEDHDILVNRWFWYRIDCKASKQMEEFIPSGVGSEWGMTTHYQAAGFEQMSPESPVVQAKNGMCQIQMRLPIKGVLPTFHRLHHLSANTNDLEPCVYGEKDGNKATYYIRCPYPGEYRFEILYMPAPNAGSGGYYTGAAFLIQCQKPVQDAFCYTDCNQLGGPMPPFFTQFGLVASTKHSTLKAQNGKATLVIEKTRPVKMFAKLYSASGEGQSVQNTSTADATTFNIELHGKGYHFFKLYACEEGETSGSLVATYCVTT